MRHHHHSPREEWSAYLDGLWGPHTVDRFASGRQLSQSAARRPACGPLLLPVLQTRCGVDGLPSPSRGTRTTTGSSPRVHLVGSAVTHIRACGAVTTLICPSAPWATWGPSHRDRGGGGGPATYAGSSRSGPRPGCWTCRRAISRCSAAGRCSRSGSTAADSDFLEETRRREAPRAAIAVRRAGQPRRLKTLDPTALRRAAAVVQLRSAPPTLPSAAVIRLAARGKSPAIWNCYSSVLRQWEAYAAREGTPFLPADPTHFANFFKAWRSQR